MLDRLDVDIALLLIAGGEGVVANFVSINDSNLSLIAIEDLGDLLEGWALGLHVEEGDEEKFGKDPDLCNVSM